MILIFFFHPAHLKIPADHGGRRTVQTNNKAATTALQS